MKIKPGMTLNFKKGFKIRAFRQRLEDPIVYFDMQILSGKSVIVLARCRKRFRWHTSPDAGLAREHNQVSAQLTIWSCLSGGKQVWITNLDRLGDIYTASSSA